MSNEKHWGEGEQKYDKNKITVNNIKNAHVLTYEHQAKGEQKSSNKLKLGENSIDDYFQNKLDLEAVTRQGEINGLTVKVSGEISVMKSA